MKNWKVNILTVKLFSVAANDLGFSCGDRLHVSFHAVCYVQFIYVINGRHNPTHLRLQQNFNMTLVLSLSLYTFGDTCWCTECEDLNVECSKLKICFNLPILQAAVINCN